MQDTIQIGNLAYSVGDQELARLFEPYGAVSSAMVSIHSDSRQSTGVGFVEMDSTEQGEAAIAALNGRAHHGRILAVCWSKPCTTQDATREEMFGPMNLADVTAPPDEEPERRRLR